MSRMFNPPHPGVLLKEDVLPSLGISVTDAASQLGVTRLTLSKIINGKSFISPDMALRLAAWQGMQMAYDLWQAEQQVPSEYCSAREI
ncbi:putative HTH-type transcriptional regulator YbaQ [Mariprofundus micogutta]|uniref:Putative HTH-type transcriptional regulator YbaQ n=1 Tax=Mariprofundus micogutta TaxID=1921010 RepID=A0A1L8CM26_9PROT|nr:HigA family addiction module antitoxin [Mariprofundus micogutta]GAV19963.1 putative HTH-type transcriptional regulator YbaQ [Mariprofundus micogutta]